MEIVILLVPLGFVLLSLAIGAFVWALRKGQFDDLDSPAWRVVFDDQDARRTNNPDLKQSNKTPQTKP